MPNLIRPTVTSVVTKEGEVVVHIEIDLNLNLNTGGVQIGVGGTPGISPVAPKPKQEESTDWVIPDFKMSGNIKFGEEKE